MPVKRTHTTAAAATLAVAAVACPAWAASQAAQLPVAAPAASVSAAELSPADSTDVVPNEEAFTAATTDDAAVDSTVVAEVDRINAALDEAVRALSAIAADPVAASLTERLDIAGTAVALNAVTAAPAKVTGIEYLINGMRIGSQIAPGLVYGTISGITVTALAGTPLQDPLGQLFAAIQPFIPQISAAGGQGADQLASGAAPLAAVNAPANEFLTAGADALDAVVAAVGPSLSPFDETLSQIAKTLRQLQQPVPGQG